jgi:hypothetical protein
MEGVLYFQDSPEDIGLCRSRLGRLSGSSMTSLATPVVLAIAKDDDYSKLEK